MLSRELVNTNSIFFLLTLPGLKHTIQGRIQQGAHPARASPKIGENLIFWHKIVIFHLKKIAPSGGRHENCWGISCEKSLFYAKKITFFPIAEGGAKSFGVFRVKNLTFFVFAFCDNNIFVLLCRGGSSGGADPAGGAPLKLEKI
jgi:hypothetical protein